jgi:hypothetical protein
MTEAVQVALIGGCAVVIVSLIAGFSAMMSARHAAAIKDVDRKMDTVVHMVDGTQTRMLDTNIQLVEEIKTLTKEWSGLAGELRGRDFARTSIEARQDQLADKERESKS